MKLGDLLWCVDDSPNGGFRIKLNSIHICKESLDEPTASNPLILIDELRNSWYSKRFLNLNDMFGDELIDNLKKSYEIYALLPHPQPMQKEQGFTAQEKLIINKAIKKHGNHLIERLPNGKMVMIRCERIKLN
jgi:hypothetical protein